MESKERNLQVLERMRLTFDLCQTAEAMMRQNLRRRHPALGAEEIEKLMDEWRLTRPGAEHGDGPGQVSRHNERDGMFMLAEPR